MITILTIFANLRRKKYVFPKYQYYDKIFALFNNVLSKKRHFLSPNFSSVTGHPAPRGQSSTPGT
jgi:hypothetical protein